MRKARIALIVILILLGLLAGVIAAGFMLLKKKEPFLYDMLTAWPQAKRADLMYLPENAPKPPRGYACGETMGIDYALGLTETADIQKPVDLPEGVTLKSDIEYGRVGDRALLLDVYAPEKLDKPVPGLIFIHGGGWKSGSKQDYKLYTIRFAKHGFVAASMGYRFVQEAPFPACVEDVKCAVRWMRENAAQLNVDPDKIVVIGGSAGGHLALMAGYTANMPELEGTGGHAGVSSAVAAVVDLYGPSDFTLPKARVDSTVTNFIKKSYEEAPELYQLASPITHVKKGVPPTLIFHGTLDHIVPISQSDLLAEKLKSVGAPYWYDCLDGYPHTMDIFMPVSDHCEKVMNLFFDQYLLGKKPVREVQSVSAGIMKQAEDFLAKIGDWVWGPPMLLMLIGTHLFLTFRLRLIQRFTGKAIRLSLQRTQEGEGEISHFGALMTALAATVGTGNIVGVATAIAAGGPGAVLWMWLTGVFGIATKYSEALLAVKYRVIRADGTVAGGPMYALERGLNAKWLGMLFAFFTAVAAFGIGDMVQANALAGVLKDTAGISPWVSGVVVTILTAIVVLGGIRSIARVSEALVPFMAIVYVVGCLVLLIMGISTLPMTILIILKGALTGQAAVGGFLGAGVRAAMRYGIARGLFSNESGLGSAPIVAAAAQTKNPVRQALVSSTGTFWDTVVICLMTGLVIVNSGAWKSGLKGAELTHQAFADFPGVGPVILTLGMITFVFSTILGWCYYGEKAIEYLLGARAIMPYRCLWVAAVMLGSVVSLPAVWSFADIANALMAVPNLIALLLLSGVVVAETRHYLWNDNMDDSSRPMEDRTK